jgi:hypothetical protein
LLDGEFADLFNIEKSINSKIDEAKSKRPGDVD